MVARGEVAGDLIIREDAFTLPFTLGESVAEARAGRRPHHQRVAEGQLRGVQEMLEAERPCVDLITQLAAAQNALPEAAR